MSLPFLVSLPHSGTRIPEEVREICRLTPQQIREDGDEGAAQIYEPLRDQAEVFVAADIARAIVDINRAEDDFHKDGVIKTHTCWDIPVYTRFPTEHEIEALLDNYYHPYHQRLSDAAGCVRVGLDCHTMAAFGPPVGPDPGVERPPVCLSNADGTCPTEWLSRLAGFLEQSLGVVVSINHPFKGGYIIRHHGKEMPWIQIEFSRSDFLAPEVKSRGLLAALRSWIPVLPDPR
jgi:N-formylglutamate amidohydrolase